MGLTEKIAFGVLAVLALIAIVRLCSTPFRRVGRILLNTLLGFAILFLVNFSAPLTGLSLGVNPLNALFIGLFGVPGFVFLFLLQWIL